MHIYSLRHLPKAMKIFFNPSCVPSTDEERALFVDQQKFGCQVLQQTTLTFEGMVIVRKHSQTKNAQSVHAKLQDWCAHSQAATLARDILEQAIADFRLNGTWKKGCAPFLIAWKNKVMDLETLQDVGDPVTDHKHQNWLTRS
jgi:hypothetical protein